MDEPGASLEQERPAACPECGNELLGRFCGRCGKRLTRATPPPETTVAGDDDPPPDTVAPDPGVDRDRAPRSRLRRSVALVGLVASVVAATVVATRPSAEVVTTAPWHRSSGMTSTVAARALSTELWRAELDLVGGPPTWQLLDVSSTSVLMAAGDGVAVFDRVTGEHRTSLPSGIWSWWRPGGPSARADDGITVLDGDELLTIDPATGDVSGRVALDGPSPWGGTIEPLPGGDHLIATTDELRRVGPGGATVWTVPVTTELGPHRSTVAGSALLVPSDRRLEVRELGSGAVRWSVDGLVDGVVPVADGTSVIVLSGGLVTSYDLGTGEERWSTAGGWPLPEGMLGVVGSDLLVSANGGASLLRYDLTTGEREERTPNGYFHAFVDAGEPIVRLVGETLLVAGPDRVQAVTPEGEPRWSAPASHLLELPDEAVALLDGPSVSVVDAATGRRRARVVVDLPPVTGTAPPIGVAGRAVSLPGGLVADLGTGEELGRLDGAGVEPWSSTAPLGDGFLVHGDMGSPPRHVDPYGRERWRFEGDTTTSVVHGMLDGLLVVREFGSSGPVLAFRDPATGEEVGAPFPYRTQDIVAPGGARAVGVVEEPRLLVAFERRRDRLVETWRTERAAFGAPVLRDEDLLVERLAGFDRYRFDDRAGSDSTRLPFVPRSAAYGLDTVAYVTADDRVVGVDVGTGEVGWEWSSPARLSGAVTVAGGVAYVGDLLGSVRALALGTGEVVAQVQVGTAPVSAIVVAHGVMLAATGDELVATGPPRDRLDLPRLPPR